jgi:hypothetical protein
MRFAISPVVRASATRNLRLVIVEFPVYLSLFLKRPLLLLLLGLVGVAFFVFCFWPGGFRRPYSSDRLAN